MTDSTGPSWTVTYRRAGAPSPEKVTVHASTMIAALKQAKALLDEAAKAWPVVDDDLIGKGRPYIIILIAPEDEPPSPVSAAARVTPRETSEAA